MKSSEYLSLWRKRKAEEKKKRALAVRKARQIAKALKKKYGAREVFLFGSLIWRPEYFWSGTDIDLMVKGLKADRFFEILADMSALSHPFRVDLIPHENAWPSIKKRARKDGLRLE